jgi:hypothetical protein
LVECGLCYLLDDLAKWSVLQIDNRFVQPQLD